MVLAVDGHDPDNGLWRSRSSRPRGRGQGRIARQTVHLVLRATHVHHWRGAASGATPYVGGQAGATRRSRRDRHRSSSGVSTTGATESPGHHRGGNLIPRPDLPLAVPIMSGMDPRIRGICENRFLGRDGGFFLWAGSFLGYHRFERRVCEPLRVRGKELREMLRYRCGLAIALLIGGLAATTVPIE